MKSNNTYLNILASYAYLNKAKDFNKMLMDSSNKGLVNVMIDSGAFTLFNAKQKREWLTLDNYCNFLDKYGTLVEKYVMLDVIGNDNKSKANYETMIKRGYNPMFVFTMADNDFSYLKDASKNNKHICVAGGVTTKGDWMRKRIQDCYKATNGLLHGLGYVSFPSMYQLPLHSVDSSSWVQASQVYGSMPYFVDKLKGVRYIEVLKKQKKLPLPLIELFEQLKITPKQFSDLSNHKGGNSIATLCSIIAYIKYQKYSKKQGIDLFLATANKKQLTHLLYVNEHLNKGTLTYENYKKL